MRSPPLTEPAAAAIRRVCYGSTAAPWPDYRGVQTQVGYLRVLEGEKARPLFVDPLAKALSGDESARAQCCRMSGLIDMPGWFMSPETYRCV